MTTSPKLEQRLAEIRGNAPRRSPTVRVLAAHSQHTDCKLAALGFAAGIDFDRILIGTRFRAPFGQSPFALGRGLAFEKRLRENDYTATFDLLRSLPGFPRTGGQAVNLRQGYPKGDERMPLRARATEALLGRILTGDPTAPHLIDGAVLPALIGGVLAHFEADAVAALTGQQIHVAEVKSFPKVDDRVDADKLGAALDQVAIYIHLLRAVIQRLGGDPERFVSDWALLITPRNVGMTPTLSQQRVTARVGRVGQLLASIPRAADVAASVPTGLSFGHGADKTADENRRLDVLHNLADTVGTCYTADCLSSCGNARFCRERAFRDGSPSVAGRVTLRLLPGVPTLGRAEELSHGAKPVTEEAPAAALLERAGRLYDAATPPTLTRRPA
jgi:hypothetical protein